MTLTNNRNNQAMTKMFGNFIAALPSTRPPFLLLAPICVCYGVSIAAYQNYALNVPSLLLAIVGAIAALMSVNCFNEYQDNASSLDANTIHTAFSGGSGLLQQRPELAATVKRMALVSLLVAFTIGGYFAFTIGIPIIPLGLLGALIIITYTRYLNKFPWLCFISPGLGIGVLISGGSYWVLTGTLASPYLWLLVIPFLLINNLLLLNQYPDISADKQAGRNHLPIAYGVAKSNKIYGVTILLTIISLILLIKFLALPIIMLIALIPITFSAIALYGMDKYQQQIASHPRYLALNAVSANLTPIVIAIILFNSPAL